MKRETFVILHNIRSAHNVGSIFRTADGAGVSKIYLTGYTPLPVDRFGRVVSEIAKTSLGATESVLWEHHEDVEELIQTLQREGVTVVAVEQDEQATSYDTYTPDGTVAYIMGNETEGISEEVRSMVDTIVDIPMCGEKESLNVSVATGVILYQDLRRRVPSSLG